MTKKRQILFLISLMVIACTFAQTKKRQSILITLIGDDYFEAGEYEQALRYYKVAFLEYPEYVKAQYQIAQCFRLIQQYDSAEHHYGLIISNEQDFRYPLARFHLAKLQMQKGQPQLALDNFKAFRSLLLAHELHELKKFSEYYEQARIEIDNLD